MAATPLRRRRQQQPDSSSSSLDEPAEDQSPVQEALQGRATVTSSSSVGSEDDHADPNIEVVLQELALASPQRQDENEDEIDIDDDENEMEHLLSSATTETRDNTTTAANANNTIAMMVRVRAPATLPAGFTFVAQINETPSKTFTCQVVRTTMCCFYYLIQSYTTVLSTSCPLTHALSRSGNIFYGWIRNHVMMTLPTITTIVTIVTIHNFYTIL